MIECILLLIATALAMLGLSELLHLIKIYILLPKAGNNRYLLVLLKGDSPQQDLISAIEEKRWLGARYAKSILAVYFSEGQSGLDACRKIAQDNDITVCSFYELSGIIEKLKD